MQRNYVRFQMKNSTRPQTIAEVFRDIDIQSFRSNPEWYEIKESVVPVQETVIRKRKSKGERDGNQEEKD